MAVLQKLLRCLVIIILPLTVSSQSFYNIEYSFDNIPRHLFLSLNDDGSGIGRLRFLENNRDNVIEYDLQESPIALEPNVTDSLHSFYILTGARNIIGTAADAVTAPNVYFEVKTDGSITPVAILPVLTRNIDSAMAGKFKSAAIRMGDLRKDFLLQYFSEDEDFYKSIFRPLTRGFSDMERNSKMFLLVVTNTNDKTIGKACRYDKERILQTFTDLSRYLGIRLVTDTVAGKIYGKKTVDAALNRLNPGPNDMVVFYYSGHGFRKAGQTMVYPLIDLRAKPADDYVKESMAMEDIYKRIKLKKARFNLVLSDCCNTEVSAAPVNASKPLKTKSAGVAWSENNIRQLFFSKTPVSVLATAANAGQKATCNSNFGGFFSWFFKSSMESSCSILKSSASWDEVFQQAQKQTINKAKFTYCEKPYIPENICDQTPVYKIEIGR